MIPEYMTEGVGGGGSSEFNNSGSDFIPPHQYLLSCWMTDLILKLLCSSQLQNLSARCPRVEKIFKDCIIF